MDRQPVESRLIRSVGYDPPASILEVELRRARPGLPLLRRPLFGLRGADVGRIQGGLLQRARPRPVRLRGGRAGLSRPALAWESRPDRRQWTGPTPASPGRPTPRRQVSSMDWSSAFEAALPYAAFLDRHATPAQRSRWDAMHGRVRLEPDQVALLGGFVRRMPVLVLAGAWCGDCVNQCPIFDHFAAASPGDRPPVPRPRRPARGRRRPGDQRRPPGPGRPVPQRGLPGGRPLRRADPLDLSPAGRRAARPGLPDRPGPPHRRRHPPGHRRVARRVRAGPAHPPPLPPAPGQARRLTSRANWPPLNSPLAQRSSRGEWAGRRPPHRPSCRR